MASIQALRRRIRSIQGTTKIVRAMEMVATAKMRRTQQRALAGRPYTEKLRQVIADLAHCFCSIYVCLPLWFSLMISFLKNALR